MDSLEQSVLSVKSVVKRLALGFWILAFDRAFSALICGSRVLAFSGPRTTRRLAGWGGHPITD